MCIFGIFEGSFRFTVSSNLKAVSMFLYLVADVLDPPASILTILMRLSRLSVSFWELLYSDNFHYLRGSFRIFLYYLIRYTPSCSWWHWCSVPSWLNPAGSSDIALCQLCDSVCCFLLLLRSLFDGYRARKSIFDLLLLRGIYTSYLSESVWCTGYDDSREQRFCRTVRLTICLSYFSILNSVSIASRAFVSL